jgi:hypothetical protein
MHSIPVATIDISRSRNGEPFPKSFDTLVYNSKEMLRLLTIAGQGVFLAPSLVVPDDLSAGASSR